MFLYVPLQVVKQTVAGHITSFTRDCHYLNNCTEVDYCEREENKQTGVVNHAVAHVYVMGHHKQELI